MKLVTTKLLREIATGKRKKPKGYGYAAKVTDGGFAHWDYDLEYKVGKFVRPDWFDDDPEEDCGHGIHLGSVAFVKEFGKDWNDRMYFICRFKWKDAVVPKYNKGKFRVRRAYVVKRGLR